MTVSILELPDELLVHISSYLILPSLQHFHLTCQAFARTSHRRLQYHSSLKRRYRRLSDQNPDHPNVWLTSLAAVLRNEVPPCYVEEVSISRAEWFWREVPTPFKAEPEREDFEVAYQGARDSPWIYEHDACGPRGAARSLAEFIIEIGEGDQDNIIAILLPLLPNLTVLELPSYRGMLCMGSLPGVIERIARATAGRLYGGKAPRRASTISAELTPEHASPSQSRPRRSLLHAFGLSLRQMSSASSSNASQEGSESSLLESPPPEPTHVLQPPLVVQPIDDLMPPPSPPTPLEIPFQKLTTIIGKADRDGGVDLAGLAPFMALPSVTTVVANGTFEQVFTWPSSSLPKSRASSIAFIDGGVSLDTAIQLAKRLVGPCLIENRRGPRARPVDRSRRWRSVAVEEDRIIVDDDHEGPRVPIALVNGSLVWPD